MNKRNSLAVWTAVVGLLFLSACGQNNATTENNSQPDTAAVQANTENPAADQKDEPDTAGDQKADDTQILVVLDQTEMPIETGGLSFSFKRIPEGYALSEMRWKGQGDPIVATYEQARENGASGGDGFYISGDGQYMGFLYPNSSKGEQGQISFVFADDAGQQMTWEKEITLQ